MSLVLDASIVAEYLIGSSTGQKAWPLMLADADLSIPHHAVVETASVLRGWYRGGHVPEARLRGALDDLADLRATRWPIDPLLPRIWDLRDRMTAYDAAYVALAEALDATLVTGDRRLARAARHAGACPVKEIETSTGR